MPELIPAAPGSPEWLAARRQGVTATDIVTILGLSAWNSPYSLYWQKMGQVPEPADNDRFRLGRELEPYVTMRWGEANPDASYDLMDPGLWRSSARPWQMATPDHVLYDGEAKETQWGVELPPSPMVGVLEVKTWADADKPSWGPSFAGGTEAPPASNVQSWQMDVVTAPASAGSPRDGAQPGPITPKIPAAVRAQVLWQMDTMDVAAGHVGVVFLPSGEFRSYVIEHAPECRHPEACYEHCEVCTDLDLMRAAGEEFMRRLRLELPAPDPDASAATLAAVKARFARQPDKTAEIDGADWETWVFNRNMAEKATEVARKYESLIREQAGEASVYTVDGQPVARRITGEAQVKAHTRHSDYLKRIAPKETDDA